MRRFLVEGIITPEDHNYSKENPWADVYLRVQNKMVDQTQPSAVEYDEKGKPYLKFDFPQGISGIMSEEEAALKPNQHLRDLVIRPLLYVITRPDRTNEKLHLSRKKAFNILAEKTWENIKLGQVKQGVIVAYGKNGIIIDIGGVNAYLHRSEIIHGAIRKPLNEIFKIGEVIDVKVIKYRKPGETKTAEQEPLSKPFYMDKAASNDTVTLKIDDSESEDELVIDNGESEEDLVIENSTDKEPVDIIDNASLDNDTEKLKIDDPVIEKPSIENDTVLSAAVMNNVSDVKITDQQNKQNGQNLEGRIWVSRKALLVDPWLDPSFQYKLGGEYVGTVVKIAETGDFVELKEGIEIKVIHAKKHPLVGTRVLVRVLDIKHEEKRMKGRYVRILS